MTGRLVRRIFNVSFFILAIKESLQKDGTLGRFKGEIRAAVTNVLNKNSETGEPPKIPDETRLINELIKEYLSWNGYLYTEQVLSAGNSWIYNRKRIIYFYFLFLESSQNGERVSRDVLTTKLGVLDDAKTAKIPLLYYIVSAFQINDEDWNKFLVL